MTNKYTEEICNKVLNVLKDNGYISLENNDDIILDSTFQHIGVEDSLELLEAIMHVEDAFDISISNSHELHTLGDLVNKIKEERGI